MSDAQRTRDILEGETATSCPGDVAGPPSTGFARLTWVLSAAFFAFYTWVSYTRWANFEYRTFDLAFYVQGLWQVIHGRFYVSLADVPLLGNHVEPIVFLIAPVFALVRHPMTLVVVQNAALGTMAPVGYQIARRSGFTAGEAMCFAAALVLAPASGYIALHEFHPEALAAPLILLMLRARVFRSLRWHWIWFLAVLACKENMALLLAAYCIVCLIFERQRGLTSLGTWYIGPLAVAVVWFALCSRVITPALNQGTIDYTALYDRLGQSAGDIVVNGFTDPTRFVRAITQSLTTGNLVIGLLIPFAGLSLLRPRWLLVAAPILLQHLLSWRSSEWMIYFHYAAPLLPLFWIACVEGAAAVITRQRRPAAVRRGISLTILGATLLGQTVWGPLAAIGEATTDWFARTSDRARKTALLAEIPVHASVVAPLPYLSHLGMRQELYSLHYVLKGLKTLSRSTYEPPSPTDYVLIDYADSATFDASAGYYHPAMKTADGRVVSSSEELLHDFLRRATWEVNSSDELTLLRKVEGAARVEQTQPEVLFSIPGTQLFHLETSTRVVTKDQPLDLELTWNFAADRKVFPWLVLSFTREGSNARVLVPKGLCAPEARIGVYQEVWHIALAARLAPGDYSLEALFFDNSKKAWAEFTGTQQQESPLLTSPVTLGSIRVATDPAADRP